VYDSSQLTDADLVTVASAGGRYRPELFDGVIPERATPDRPASLQPRDFGLPVSGWEHAVILFEASWCGACRSLRKNVLDRPDFVRLVSEAEFLVIDVDSNIELPRRYGVHVVPTVFVTDRRGTILLRVADPAATSLVEQIAEVLRKG